MSSQGALKMEEEGRRVRDKVMIEAEIGVMYCKMEADATSQGMLATSRIWKK